MDFKEYERKFRQRSTHSLIKGYPKFNEDFRRIARSEFKKRGVPQSKLPYKKPKTRSRVFDFPSFF